MSKFWQCRDGNFAVVFAVAIIPVLGAAGMAIDYSRATNVQDFLQAQNDNAAISGSKLGPTGDPKLEVEHLKAATIQRFAGQGWAKNVTVRTEWLSNTDYKVTTSLDVPVTILAAVPGFRDEVPLEVTSVVRIAQPRMVYKEPEIAQLDPEAGDYNRMYVYCFDPEENRTSRARTQMTAIADNGGTKYDFTMPRCEAHETMSYRLMNVRNARTDKSLWDKKNGVERYNYYSDTTSMAGRETYDLDGWLILETVLCKNLAECKPKSQGGVIPEGKERIPQQANQPCGAGKYMYYGWEDRPPGNGWTDKDYDDIRVIIECPMAEEVGDRMVRLIR